MIIRVRLGDFDSCPEVADSAVVRSTTGDVATKMVSVAFQ
jgi:hypothetical protein